MPVKTYSFRKRLYTIFYALLVIQLIGFAVYASIFSYSLRRSVFRESRDTLSLYNVQIGQNLQSVDYYLTELFNYNPEISLIATLSDTSEHYGDIIRINNQFEFIINSFPSIIGLYAYFPNSDTWIACSSDYQTRQTLQPFLLNQFRNKQERASLQEVNGLYWIPYEFEDSTCFVKVFDQNGAILGAWTDIECLTASLTSLKNLNTIICFIDETGHILPMGSASPFPDQPDLQIPVHTTRDDYQILKIDGERYLALTEEMPYCRFYLAALVPLTNIDGTWRRSATYLVLSLLITALVLLLASRILSRFFSRTLGLMSNVTDAILRGESEKRIDLENQDCEEIRQIADAYNHMLDSIQSLKINVYEEQLNKRTFQLYALRSQIAPHFLINCLNMISYLADGAQDHTLLIRQMIETLSKHLRYTLSTRDSVPLSEELLYHDNYVALSELRFPGCITYEKEVDERALNARAFPLLLIMLTENTFKYNLVMGEPLKLIVRVEVNEAGDRIHLVHIDSGEGYPQDFLDRYSNEGEEYFDAPDGQHIGIRNNIQRLKLYFGETAEIKFSNEPGLGARVDIDIPLLPLSESERLNQETNKEAIIS
ncbi:MAG: histidine kinase [Lachnospiraceae bacterium]|nr:histidine kinase [Lachnospiraceae bacterium]